MSKALRLRLPLLVGVGVGVLLWQSDLFVQTRELTIALPACEPLASVDVQLYDGEGQLLRRTERSFPDGAAVAALKEELQLRRGRYDLTAFLEAKSGASWTVRRTLDVAKERGIVVELSCKP